jgi:hypothetical protein
VVETSVAIFFLESREGGEEEEKPIGEVNFF